VQAAQVLQTSMEVLETSLYTFREVQITLAKYKGDIVPASTLRRWISQIGIEPDEFGCYSREDLTILARLIFWLRRGKTIQTFAQIIQKELTTNGY
jgi:DNA-binding transcriptional MerR regulator